MPNAVARPNCASTRSFGRGAEGYAPVGWAFLLAAQLGCLGIFGTTQPATAESLTQALTAAYESSPELEGQRARQRATDEQVPRAKSGWRPVIQGEASYGREKLASKPGSLSDGTRNPQNYGVTLTQPVFDGFRTRNGVASAEARVRAGRATLRANEASVLLQAATAYMNVVRDKTLVTINERNVHALSQELRAARERRAVREVTRTDVAQAEARRARALSALDDARADLKSSRADYRRVVGHEPQRLRMPPLRLRLIPRHLEGALQYAQKESPLVLAALYQEQAARHEVDRIWGELLPQVRVEASYLHERDPGAGFDHQNTASVVGRVTIPFYSGGETRSRVREAKHQHVGRLQDIERARREVEARVTAAWSRLMAERSRIKSDKVQVRAQQTALQGVRAEQEAGQRTLLDVLDAEQELLEAEAALVRSKRNAVVAQYTLLAEMGRLEAEILSLPTAIYDAEIHYEEARGKWFTVSIAQPDPEPVHISEKRDRRNAWQLRPAVAPTEGLAPVDLKPGLAPQPQATLRTNGLDEPGLPRFEPVFPGDSGSAKGLETRPRLRPLN